MSSLNDPIELSQPTLDQLAQETLNAILVELPGSNPFLDSSFLKAMSVAFAGVSKQLYIQMQQELNALFLTSTQGDFAGKWAAIFDFSQLAATQAKGPVNFQGVIGTLIPEGTAIQSDTGNTYTSQSDATVTLIQELGLSGTVFGSTVTLTYVDHELATGNVIVCSGPSESPINGEQTITVIDKDTFSYEVVGTVTPGAINGINVDTLIAKIEVLSNESGSDQNVGQGPQMSLQDTIAGIEDQGYVPFAEIKGGTDEETPEQLRDRTITRFRKPIAEFSSNDILEQIGLLNLSDQSVVVQPFDPSPTPPSPAPGQVIIVVVFLEDDGTTIRNPTTTELDLIKEQLDTITPANNIKPSVGSTNVDVTAPIALPEIEVEISNLFPGPSSMTTAIENNLKAYFADKVTVSQADPELFETTEVTMNQITTVIGATVDTETGESPITFNLTLNGGTSDISVATLERPVLKLPVLFI